MTQRVVIFGLYAIFFVPLWIVLPAMNEYIIARRCEALHGVTNGPACGRADVSASAADWGMYTMLACNAPSMLVALPLGQISDHWGRRPVLLWCCTTQLFGSAGMLLVCLLKLDLIWMVPTCVFRRTPPLCPVRGPAAREALQPCGPRADVPSGGPHPAVRSASTATAPPAAHCLTDTLSLPPCPRSHSARPPSAGTAIS